MCEYEDEVDMSFLQGYLNKWKEDETCDRRYNISPQINKNGTVG